MNRLIGETPRERKRLDAIIEFVTDAGLRGNHFQWTFGAEKTTLKRRLVIGYQAERRIHAKARAPVRVDLYASQFGGIELGLLWTD